MGYLSPEQAQGHMAGPPSDVFSLGCVLTFAATGMSPLSVGTDALPAAVVYRVVQEDPDLGKVPVHFRQLIQARLAKDPALRPDSPATNLVMSGGTRYLGAKSEPLYAPNPASGKLKWAAQPGNGSLGADPVIADGMVYFTDSNAVLQAVNASTGKRVWAYHTGGKPTAGPAVAGGFAFSATPAIAGGLVLAGCADGSLYAIRT